MEKDEEVHVDEAVEAVMFCFVLFFVDLGMEGFGL